MGYHGRRRDAKSSRNFFGPPDGTDSQLKRISGKLNIGNADNPLEIRSIFFGDGNLQLIGISLKKES